MRRAAGAFRNAIELHRIIDATLRKAIMRTSENVAVSPSQLLTPDDVAAQLGVPCFNVTRLIARGRIPAITLGQAGQMRVAVDDLTNYAKSGADDFDPPPLAGIWFDSRETWKAQQLSEAIFASTSFAWPTADEVQTMAAAAPTQQNFTATLTVDQIRSVVVGPIPDKGIVIPGAPKSRFKSFGGLFVADAWRDAAKKVLGMSGNVKSLYETPAVYRDTLDKAWAMLQQKRAATTKTYAVKRPHPENVFLQVVIPYSAICACINRATVERLAF